jgi:lauroyl/myristoyl acyltransferase
MSLLERLPGWSRIRDELRHDSKLWRKAIRAGAVHGPDAFVRYAPPIFGLAFAAALPAVRARVRQNLIRARGPRSAATDALDTARLFANFASSLTDAFAVGSDRGERLVASIEGENAFIEARSLKRGMIVLTAHTSGWHASGPVLASDQAAAAILVMRKERDPAAAAIQELAREHLGARTLQLDGNDPLAALPLLGHLRGNGVVAFQIDRLPPHMRGRKVRFLDEDTALPEGPFRLAALSGAPIVVVLGRRLGFMRYALEASPPILLPRRPSDAELDDAAARVAAAVERFVRLHPTEWFDFG